jgi:hypothetical protein
MVRQRMSEPAARVHFPATPSVGMFTGTHCAVSAADTGREKEITAATKGRSSSTRSARAIIFIVELYLTDYYMSILFVYDAV